MAGGKVSPRQKMINMMYLVLTALLALNVSKEVLLSFQVIGDSLSRSASELNKKNDKEGSLIMEQVDKEVASGKKRLAWIKGAVQEVLDKSDAIIVVIEGHVTKMYSDEVAGTEPETGAIAKMDEVETNYNYWMIGKGGLDTDNNGRGSGEALKLRKQLEDYVLFANKLGARFEPGDDDENWKRYQKEGMRFLPIAPDPKDMPNIKKNSDAYSQKWEYYIFHNSPAIANVAILQKLKNDVRHIETELLEMSKIALSEIPFKIDSLVVVAAPSANIVPAGIPFTADLYVTTSSSGPGAKPRFGGSGKINLKDGGNSATLEIATTNLKAGRQTYTYTAQVLKSGEPKTLSGKGEFEVVTPGVKVQSGQVNKLYYECYNLLEVTSPLLREFYNPKFTATGGEAIQSTSKKDEVLLVPSSGKMVLRVFNNFNGQTMKLDEITYGVTKPPRPGIGIKVGGQIYQGTPVPKALATFQLVPNGDFARTNPKDANYFFEGYEVLVRKGLTGPKTVDRGGGTAVAVIDLASIPADRGESVTVRFTGVKRKNFQGKILDETFIPSELVTVFTIK
ncbi:MAG: hypothetical protein LW884_01395 [Bacteroidetes bacterium]|jgi:gliding motility-associated protein GldM|nr:hypothetical protein [Bacteroidota bacterium]